MPTQRQNDEDNRLSRRRQQLKREDNYLSENILSSNQQEYLDTYNDGNHSLGPIIFPTECNIIKPGQEISVKRQDNYLIPSQATDNNQNSSTIYKLNIESPVQDVEETVIVE